MLAGIRESDVPRVATRRGRPSAVVRYRYLLTGSLLLTILAVWTRPVAAQYVPFGKNKVQYNDFDWHVLSGPHVDVYYYPEEERLARMALSYAEESFDTLVVLFRHRPFRRVPLIIYSSHQHFEQTNVTPGFLPEGVAGFTEFLKRRIALPFNGSYRDFQHVIRHELVHFFQISKLSRTFAQYSKFRSPLLPLWWSEGLAERFSSPQDTEDRMYIRDLVLSGDLPPLQDLSYIYNFVVAYPLGGEIHRYLGERFGYERVADLYDVLWKYDSFDEAFKAVYGISLKDLDRQWRFDLERRYFPMYADREPVAVDTRPVVIRGSASFKPVVHRGEDGEDQVFFLSPRTGYTTIYRTSLEKGDAGVEQVVQGQRSAEFESFHFFDSKIDVSKNGRLAFISKYLERDALFIWDLQKGRVVGRYQFPELVALSSPSWSPDGEEIVFSGLGADGISDLYVLDFRTQEHRRLTEDTYKDGEPDWSPDGRYIVFSSDRTAFGRSGDTNLFLYDLSTGRISYLTYGPWKDRGPRWSPDGDWIAFTSDRQGVFDLYLVDRSGHGGRLTDYTGGSFDAAWTPDERGLVFGAYEDGAFDIYYRPLTELEGNPGPKLADAFDLPADRDTTGWSWDELNRPLLARAKAQPYRTKFSLDFAAGEAAFAPGVGSAQGAQILATDMLGNQLLFLGISAQQFGEISDFLSSFSGQLLYYNLSHRVNWGTGVFRFDGRFVDQAFRNVFDENTYGVFFLASYPFSKFRRVSVQTVIERSDRKDRFNFVSPIENVELFDDTLSLTRKGVIVTNFLSYVKDNSLWLPTGPIDGMRFNFTTGLVTDLTKARAESYSVQADLRRYFRTSLLSSYAVRLFGYYSDGAIPSRIALGGSNSLRLYPFLGLFGSRAWMVNQEWRFPLTRGIAIAFPFGTLRFPGIQGALFTDLGSIWLEDRRMEGAWGSYGASFRMSLGAPLVLRLDVGKRFTLGDLPTSGFRDFGGTEVDFFFGFDY